MDGTPDWTAWERGEWRRWHRARENELRSPYGWLAVTALHWLDATPAPIEGFPGLWSGTGNEVTVRFDDQDEVARDGSPVGGTETFELEEDESDDSLFHDGVVAEVGIRGGRAMVRLRDPRAQALADFAGVPTYDWDERWIVAAHFVAYDEEMVREIATAHPDVRQPMTFWGEVSFALDDRDATLLVSGGHGSAFVVFGDATNGIDTADWRRVALGEIDPAGGTTVDFNRATNLPSAFIPGRATCPRPEPENHLPFPVTAGEKHPGYRA